MIDHSNEAYTGRQASTTLSYAFAARLWCFVSQVLPMLTSHYWSSLAFIREKLCRDCSSYKMTLNTFKITAISSRVQWVNPRKHDRGVFGRYISKSFKALQFRFRCCCNMGSGPCFAIHIQTVFLGIGNPFVKITRPWNCFIFIIGISMLASLYVETTLWCLIAGIHGLYVDYKICQLIKRYHAALWF